MGQEHSENRGGKKKEAEIKSGEEVEAHQLANIIGKSSWRHRVYTDIRQVIR